MSGAPCGWDEKSWSDVLSVKEAVAAELARLLDLVGQEAPDASAIDAAFRNIRTLADVGSFASSWCRWPADQKASHV